MREAWRGALVGAYRRVTYNGAAIKPKNRSNSEFPAIALRTRYWMLSLVEPLRIDPAFAGFEFEMGGSMGAAPALGLLQ